MSSEYDVKANKHGTNILINVKGLSRERPWLLPSVSHSTGGLTRLHVYAPIANVLSRTGS